MLRIAAFLFSMIGLMAFGGCSPSDTEMPTASPGAEAVGAPDLAGTAAEALAAWPAPAPPVAAAEPAVRTDATTTAQAQRR